MVKIMNYIAISASFKPPRVRIAGMIVAAAAMLVVANSLTILIS